MAPAHARQSRAVEAGLGEEPTRPFTGVDRPNQARYAPRPLCRKLGAKLERVACKGRRAIPAPRAGAAPGERRESMGRRLPATDFATRFDERVRTRARGPSAVACRPESCCIAEDAFSGCRAPRRSLRSVHHETISPRPLAPRGSPSSRLRHNRSAGAVRNCGIPPAWLLASRPRRAPIVRASCARSSSARHPIGRRAAMEAEPT